MDKKDHIKQFIMHFYDKTTLPHDINKTRPSFPFIYNIKVEKTDNNKTMDMNVHKKTKRKGGNH